MHFKNSSAVLCTAEVSNQMVGLFTLDRRDEGGCEWQPYPIALAVPYSLSEGSGRPSGLSGPQGQKRKEERGEEDLFMLYKCKNTIVVNH